MAARRPDFFSRAHHFVHRLKALVFEIALLITFLVWIWSKVKHDLGF
jgi:heme A synthase